ncbi:MAG: CZB domain-containing protein [Rhodoferax sp.]|nr:CZB domain-containing protein [Rhodoferax sp.]
MDLNNAVQKHAEWKIKLRSAISKHAQMDVPTLARDDCCELGQWLHGEAKARFGTLGAHADCVRKHQVFHTEVAKVAAAVNAGRYTHADSLLGAGGGFASASSALSVAFMQLRKSAEI